MSLEDNKMSLENNKRATENNKRAVENNIMSLENDKIATNLVSCNYSSFLFFFYLWTNFGKKGVKKISTYLGICSIPTFPRPS